MALGLVPAQVSKGLNLRLGRVCCPLLTEACADVRKFSGQAGFGLFSVCFVHSADGLE